MNASALDRFAAARLGLFVHYGLYSGLGRGEWTINREGLTREQVHALGDRFDPHAFDAGALADLAVRAGARYLCFTTMHHEGFALYDSDVNPFCSARVGPRRDLVAEVVAACRQRGLGVHLYHSLNHWLAEPGGAEALESDDARTAFVGFAHERVRELVTRFDPIDCLWYDGWWPFTADGWRAEAMNAMVRGIQPHILFNGRNGLPGDFATPEQHLDPPSPHRPWEACVTHNRNWGFHAGDTHWKSTGEVIDLVTQVAAGAGNLLFNVGPDGAGRVPEPSVRMLGELGEWMRLHGEALYGSDLFDGGQPAQGSGAGRGDWFHHGRLTARGKTLYLHLHSWPGESFTLCGLQVEAQSCRLLHPAGKVAFEQSGGRVVFTGLPAAPPHPEGGVLALACDSPPRLYLSGGFREPRVPHPRYDPTSP